MLLITITDINDNNPQFQNRTYMFDIDENSDNGTSVGRIEVYVLH